MSMRASRIPNEGNFLGSIMGVSDGQTHEIVQPNGIEAGEVVFKPPQALLDGKGLFANVLTAIPDLNKNSILSLNAEDSSGNKLFTAGINAGMVIPCLLNTLGVLRTTQDFVPPQTKVGWYDSNNPIATKFGAHNLTEYKVMGVTNGVAREHIQSLKMIDSEIGRPGALVMGGWQSQDDFGRVTHIFDYVEATNQIVAGGDFPTGQLADFVISIEYAVDNATKAVTEIGDNTIITPDFDSNVQISGLPNDEAIDIAVRCFPLYRVLPLGLVNQLAVGRIVYSDGEAGGDVGVDFQKV